MKNLQELSSNELLNTNGGTTILTGITLSNLQGIVETGSDILRGWRDAVRDLWP